MLSTADDETLKIEFGQATDAGITTALMTDELSEYATCFNELRIDIIQGKFDELIHPKDRKRANFMQHVHDNQTRDQYSQDRGFAWPRWVISEKQPACALTAEQVVHHFGPIWNPRMYIHDSFVPSSEWKLQPIAELVDKKGITANRWLEFATSEEEILKVVKSRATLSAIGLDGIGYQMVKLGGTGAINFLKLLFHKIITEKKIPRSWKMARTVLLYKKGERDDPKNWRPISITNAISITEELALHVEWRDLCNGRKREHAKRSSPQFNKALCTALRDAQSIRSWLTNYLQTRGGNKNRSLRLRLISRMRSVAFLIVFSCKIWKTLASRPNLLNSLKIFIPAHHQLSHYQQETRSRSPG
jgi:hypothetical protein